MKNINDLIELWGGRYLKEFSDKYEIPYRTLQDWTSGRRNPPDYVLKLLERAIIQDNQEEEEIMTQRERFDSEEQYDIARESFDKAYEDRYGVSGYEDPSFTGGNDTYENFVDLVLSNSPDECFHGTDEEIRDGWYNLDMFE